MKQTVSQYIGTHSQQLEAVLELPFGGKTVIEDNIEYVYIPIKESKFEGTLDCNVVYNNIFASKMDHSKVSLIPRPEMSSQVWKFISKHSSAPKCISNPISQKPPTKDIPNGIVQFYPKCGESYFGCKTTGTVTIALEPACNYFLAKTKEINHKVPFRTVWKSPFVDKNGTFYCKHLKHQRIRKSLSFSKQQIIQSDARRAALYDLTTGKAQNVNEISDINKNKIYQMRSQYKKDEFSHELPQMAVHINQIKSVYETPSKIQYFTNVPLELSGSIHDCSVGFSSGGAAYSLKS